MRIAYGVMGYGRGHATRSSAALAALEHDHEITVFTSGDAYDLMAARFNTVRIPMLGYAYTADGRWSVAKTLVDNFSGATDLLFHGAGVQAVEREFRERGIELVISDSEAWTHRAAQHLKIPRISFDHVGIIAWCKPHFPDDLWLTGLRDGWGYRQLMGQPDRILISSFYPAEPKSPTTRLVGPLLRESVQKLTPSDGGFLLAYFNRGDRQFHPHVEQALRQIEHPVIVYGTSRVGISESLDFRAIDGDAFVRDLAACRAVIATAGSQLIGEALYFGKPFLALPERAFEQQLNARTLERMGVGRFASLETLSAADIEIFLADLSRYRDNLASHTRNGRTEALEILRGFIAELSPPLTPRQHTSPPPVNDGIMHS